MMAVVERLCKPISLDGARRAPRSRVISATVEVYLAYAIHTVDSYVRETTSYA